MKTTVRNEFMVFSEVGIIVLSKYCDSVGITNNIQDVFDTYKSNEIKWFKFYIEYDTTVDCINSFDKTKNVIDYMNQSGIEYF